MKFYNLMCIPIEKIDIKNFKNFKISSPIGISFLDYNY